MAHRTPGEARRKAREKFTLDTDPVIAELRKEIAKLDEEEGWPIIVALYNFIKNRRTPPTDMVGDRKVEKGYRIHDPLQEMHKDAIIRERAERDGVDVDFALTINSFLMRYAMGRQFKRARARLARPTEIEGGD